MHSLPVGPDDATGHAVDPDYRVRVWSSPPAVGYAWSLDEWDLSDVSDVAEVIQWAEGEASGRPFEIFARWQATPVDQARFIRLLGRAPDDGGATETILYSADL